MSKNKSKKADSKPAAKPAKKTEAEIASEMESSFATNTLPGTAEAPSPAKKQTPAEAKDAFAGSTFKNAEVVARRAKDTTIADQLQEAIDNKDYSPALAHKAADLIEAEIPDANGWLIADLRKI